MKKIVEFLSRPFVTKRMESNGSDASNRKNNSSVTMVVTGYDTSLPDDDVKSLLSEHFSSCGEITKVYIPTDVRIQSRNKYAFVDITGEDAEEKALQLNGSAVGGRNVSVKVMPPSTKCWEATPELYVNMAEHREKELTTPGINLVFVSGFDTSLDENSIKDSLEQHFSSCGKIRVVRVHDETATIQIIGVRGEVGAKSMALNGKDMGGWKAKVKPFAELEEVNFNTIYGITFPSNTSKKKKKKKKALWFLLLGLPFVYYLTWA